MKQATKKQIDKIKRMYDFIKYYEDVALNPIDYACLSSEEASTLIRKLQPQYNKLNSNPALRKKYKQMHPTPR